MTVWIVTEGEYSDYHIEAVFTTETAAAAYRSEREAMGRRCYVEAWSADERAGWVKRPAWRSLLYLTSGSQGPRGWSAGEIIDNTSQADPEDVMSKPSDRGRHEPVGYGLSCLSFVSQDHAHKLAAEAWQKYLRNGKKWEDAE